MDQSIRDGLSHQEIPCTDRYRDETTFAADLSTRDRCEPTSRKHPVRGRTSQPVHEHAIALQAPLGYSSLAQQGASPPEKHGNQRCQEAGNWTFPHIAGSNYQPLRKSRALIDTYTASYIRWQNRDHVLAWIRSFDHQLALRPVFIDTETTGARRSSEIVEICIVDEQGQTLFRSLINPTTEIEAIASTVHGLTRKHVKDAPRYSELHDEVMQHLHNRVVIAYSVSFDMRLLKQTANCYKFTFPELHTGCLMYAYAKYRGEYVEQRNGQRRYKTHRLEEAIKYERLDIPPSHRAERDAQCIHRLFHALKVQSQSDDNTS
jgi:DNA polymerase III subunit epsilon